MDGQQLNQTLEVVHVPKALFSCIVSVRHIGLRAFVIAVLHHDAAGREIISWRMCGSLRERGGSEGFKVVGRHVGNGELVGFSFIVRMVVGTSVDGTGNGMRAEMTRLGSGVGGCSDGLPCCGGQCTHLRTGEEEETMRMMDCRRVRAKEVWVGGMHGLV